MDVNKNNNQGEKPECIDSWVESERKWIISKSIKSLCALSLAATMYIVDPKSSYADTQWVDNLWVTSTLVSWEKAFNKTELTSKEIFTQLQEIWVSPDKLEGSIIRAVFESDEVAQTPMLKSDLFWEWPYTVDNIISRLEETARLMNEKYNSQYKPWDWTEAMKLVKPLEEESIMLNNYLRNLTNQIEKPLDAWQTMVSLLALDRYDKLEKTPLMNFLLLDDAYKVLKVVRPDLVNNAVVVELWEEYDRKTYTIVQPTAENMFAVNKFLYNKLPAEIIIDFEEAYSKIVEEWKKEFRERAIAEYVDEYWYTLEEAILEVESEIETTLLPIFDWLKKRTWKVSKPWSNTLINYIPDTVSNYFSWLPWDYDIVYSWLEVKKIRVEWEKIRDLNKWLKEVLQKLWQSV